jgi:hypothetical protein
MIRRKAIVLGGEAPRNRVDVFADASSELVRFTRDPRAAPSRVGSRLPPGAGGWNGRIIASAPSTGAS